MLHGRLRGWWRIGVEPRERETERDESREKTCVGRARALETSEINCDISVSAFCDELETGDVLSAIYQAGSYRDTCALFRGLMREP